MKKVLSICVVVVFLLSVDAMGGYTQGFVDLDNLQLLAGDWLQVDGSDMDDFAILAQYWYTDQTPPSPDHHWPFEDVSGTEVNDIIGHEKLVETAGFTIADANILGRAGYGIRFEGSNDERISHPTLLDDLDPTDSITIMMWVRPMSDNLSTGGGLFQKQNNSTQDQLQFYAPKDGSYRVQLRNNGNDGGGSHMSTLTGVAVEVDVWRHVAFVWTPTDAYLYIDGQLEDTEAEGTMGAGDYHDMSLGTANFHLNPFGGTIDDFRIYNSALSAAQIANVYDSYPPVTYYTLTVTDGPYGSGATGGGVFLNEQVVPITAGTPDPGYMFWEWTGDTSYLADAGATTTTIVMPATDVTVTATYCFCGGTTLVVNNGTGSGYYPEGASVPIEADAPADANDIFVAWTGHIQYLDDPNSPSATVTMPGVAVIVTATYDNRTNLLSMHWPMEETSGTTSENVASDVDDLVAIYSYDISAMTTVGGRVNNAFTFEDNSAALEVPGIDAGLDPAGLDIFPDEITVTAWLKFTDGTNGDSCFLSKKPYTNYGFYTVVDDDYFDVSLQINNSGLTKRITGTTVNPESDTWYHYAMTWVGNDMRLYIDGVQDGATYTGQDIADFPDAIPGNTSGYDTLIGSGWAHVYAYTGILDEVKIYKAALTPQQIMEAYESYPPVPMYTLTVNDSPGGNGVAGGGTYPYGDEVEITSNVPECGYLFWGWTGDTELLADPDSPTTTLVMPAQDVTVTANYAIPLCGSEVTVINGTGSGYYLVGDCGAIEIAADISDANYIFTGWTGDVEYITDTNSPNTTIPFITDCVNIELTANVALRTDLLKVWWPLEETSGNDSNNILSTDGYTDLVSTFDIADRTSSGANAVVGNAMRFDDAESYYMKAPGIDEGQPPTFLDIFPDSLTISGWLKTTAENDSYAMWLGFKPITDYGFYLTAESDGFYVKLGIDTAGTNWQIGGTDPVVDTWYHYAMTWEGTNVAFYLDGELDSSDSSFYDIADFPDATGEGTNTYSIMLGSGWLHVNTFTGYIDEVKMWKAALTPQQIAEEYGSY